MNVDSVGRHVVFSALDTVKKASGPTIEETLKLNLLFNPHIAFSDTQLIDNASLWVEPTPVLAGLLSEDSYYLRHSADRPTVNICIRSAGIIDDAISMQCVLENMLRRQMYFSCFEKLFGEEEGRRKNEALKAEAQKKAKKDKWLTMDDFLDIFKDRKRDRDAFLKYIYYIDDIFNMKAHCGKQRWNFPRDRNSYKDIVVAVLEKKKELTARHGILRSGHDDDFLKSVKETGADRTKLYEAIGQFRAREQNIYYEIVNYLYLYNLAFYHNYYLIRQPAHRDYLQLYRESGLYQNPSSIHQDLAKAQRELKRIKAIRYCLNLDKINYDDIEYIRASDEYYYLLTRGFYANCRVECLEEYVEFIFDTISPDKLIKGVIDGAVIPLAMLGIEAVKAFFEGRGNFLIALPGFFIAIYHLYEIREYAEDVRPISRVREQLVDVWRDA